MKAKRKKILLEFLTNWQLYEKIKEALVEEVVRGVRSPILDYAYDECLKRDETIYEKALLDSNFEIISMESYMPGLRVVKTHRIDFMDEAEIIDLIEKIGASTNFPDLQSPKLKLNSLFDLIGVEKSNLMICIVSGESMIGAGIEDGDTVFIDKSDKGGDGSIVVASAAGNMLVKRLKKSDGELYLMSENQEYEPIKISPDMNLDIVGAVKQILKKVI